ncbi:MAG: 7TM domain-containing protein [Patescibacteria group bacterium]|nr:7TM domain-containing protein [Candidatus Beckwithbacteria bacterium]MDZ4229025.1 7TM domain-containing protein [Patescibacteria group bacterium]
MKHFLLGCLLLLFAALPVKAQEEASPSAVITASESASQQIQKVTAADITERTSPVKGKLEGYLAQKDPGELSWKNWLQYAIRQGIDKGVSANTIVLVLLFPLVAGLIAAGRHLLGFQGFGIFVPAMLAVALLATGIKVGLVLFIVIWLTATVARKITRKLQLQYLPRLALLMWFISLGVLGVLLGAVNVEAISSLSAASIFPILILMLLTENFIEVQTGKSRREANSLILQTLLMAVGTAMLLRLDALQRFVLLNPEVFLLLVAGFDWYVGRYVGLRALEWVKFRKLVQ